MAIKFYGSFDDNFVFKGPAGAGEISCYDKFAEVQVGTIEKNCGVLIVRGEYVDPGVWTIGVRPLDEDTRMPEWPIKYRWYGGYTPVLIVECPEDVFYGRIE